jgi:hypothetical protein
MHVQRYLQLSFANDTVVKNYKKKPSMRTVFLDACGCLSVHIHTHMHTYTLGCIICVCVTYGFQMRLRKMGSTHDVFIHHIHVHTVYVCKYINIYIYIYIYIYTHTHKYKHVNTCAHMHYKHPEQAEPAVPNHETVLASCAGVFLQDNAQKLSLARQTHVTLPDQCTPCFVRVTADF